jgi:putative ABC transport system ATP-binding protein
MASSFERVSLDFAMQMIQVSELHKTYDLGKSKVDALRGVTLAIDEGEWVFLSGPSGSGKSTLLHLIGGLDHPSAGQVIVGGLEIGQEDDELSDFRRAKIGFVFQTFNLLPVLTVSENVEYPLLLRKVPDRSRRVKKMLDEVGLSEFAAHYPNELSGGQRQRVAIARALVHEPMLLIADEPTANLDSETGERVMELILRLAQKHGSTLLICTHNPELLAVAPRVLLMRDGLIEGDHRQMSAAQRMPPVVRCA